MGSVGLALPSHLGKPGIVEILDLVGLPSKAKHSKQPSAAVAESLIDTILPIVDDLIQRALSERTAELFAAARLEVFPQYFAAMTSLGSLIRIALPEHKIEQLAAESLAEMEAEFREHGVSTFGADLTDRGLFTIWTLRKINDLAREIGKIKPVELGHTIHADKANNFAIHAVWTRFHIDCLAKAMRLHKPVYPEVVEPMRDGLRAAVDAYAWLRQCVDSCLGAEEPVLPVVAWDAEDEALLSDSMRDLAD
jgi:hypothetical protein